MRCIAIALLFAACVPEEEGETEATGTAMYRDAETTSDGTMTRDPDAVPEQPNADPMRVSLEVEGTGTLEVGDSDCQDLTGAFRGLYEGDADVDGHGVYVASMADSEFETPSGCSVPSLSIGLVTDIVARGELSATSQNCDTYCAAKARSVAETECDGDADEASCRAAAEATYEASCTTSCTSTTHVIVAETSVGSSVLGGLTDLDGSALGTIEADLTFDHVEDADGNTVSEAP